MKAVKIGYTDNGKDKYKIMRYSSDIKGDWIEIPCGKCIGCRLDHARSWADRCYLESLYHDSNYFVTLTYDDAHIPIEFYEDPDTAEALQSYTLRKKHLQKFMKDLRSRLDYKVRFFACGEYGGNTLRPHYHLLLFGLRLNDLELYNVKNGFYYYNSPFLSSVWKNGFAVVSPLTYSTCAYTARYVVKKAKQYDRCMYSLFNMEPEFTLMSRKPGIAYQFFQDHDCYKYDYMALPSPDGAKKIYPMRYFDKQLEKVDPDKLALLKEKRLENSKRRLALKLEQTDLDYLEMLDVAAANRLTKVDMARNNMV